MLLSYSWLEDFLDLEGIEAEVLADRMSRTGLEVEGLKNYSQDLSGLVVGEVVEMADHPDADSLRVCQVQTSATDRHQIVCGAPNVAVGQKVITALPGAKLPGIEIGQAKLRGVESNGMLCSLQELGFSDSVIAKEYADGLFILPNDAPLGEDVVAYLGLDDYVLDIDLTPNRSDAMSMVGLAYEVGAILDQKPQFETLEPVQTLAEDSEFEAVSVTIESEDLANAYELRLVRDVEIHPSPLWMQMRLMKMGIRPINNVVDITNYCLLLYGQPLHAFDFDQLPAKDFHVRRAAEGEVFVTLDNTQRILSQDEIVIAAGDTAVALAGVMGGQETEVTDATRNVLIESAVFNPLNIRKTSGRFDLRSESSARFEKGINEATISLVGEQACAWLSTLAAGVAVEGSVSQVNQAAQSGKVEVPYASIPGKIGIELSQDDIRHIMDRLGFEATYGETSFEVVTPPRRWDLAIEADILEEIARIYGYDNIPSTLPIVPATPGALNKRQRLVRKTRELAESYGLNQVISYVLTSEKAAQLMASGKDDFVRLAYPMSEERTVMRQSMLPALLEIMRYNHARHNRPLAFYEVGRVFFNQVEEQLPREEERLAFMVSGQKDPSSWYEDEQLYDFYDMKGIIEGYFGELRLGQQLSFEVNAAIEEMHPGRTANILLDGEVIGLMGQIHPNLAKDYDLEANTFFAELDLDILVNYSYPELVQQSIPRFPATSRDLALLVSDDQTNEELLELIQSQGGDYLQRVELFDLYKGEGIPAGKQSMAYHLTFLNPQATLTDKEIDASMADIAAALKTFEGLEIR